MDKAPEAFRTISEVADWLGVQPHVLRFWESKFPQIKPVKRAGGRRYYRPADMLLLGGLKQLLHEDGLTIKGAQKVLREQGVQAVQAISPPLEDDAAADSQTDRAAAPVVPAPVQDGEAATPDQPDAAHSAESEAEPSDTAQTRMDLPQVRLKPRPSVEATPEPLEDSHEAEPAPQAAASKAPAAEPEPSTPSLFDAGLDMPDGAHGTAGSGSTAQLPSFRSRLGATLGAHKSSSASRAGTPADAPAETEAAEAPEAPPAPAQMAASEQADAPASDTGAESTAQAPTAARLPESGTDLQTALGSLAPGQVAAIKLRPYYEQLVALRDRMDEVA